MFNNIGKTLKIIAWIEMILGIILSIISGVVTLTIGVVTLTIGQVILGLIIIVAGILFSWLGVLVLYAIGHIAENTEKILEKLNLMDIQNKKPSVTNSQPKYVNGKYVSNTSNTKSEEWICSCGAKNSGMATSCNTCFKKRA